MTLIRVLIVEDDPRIADLHRRFVEKVEGFEVVGIANGLEEAEEMVEILGPDLLLLDLFFPEGSGMGLLWKMRAQGRRIDMILITAAREAESVQEALRGGAFDYIIKPVILSRFRDSLVKYRQFREQVDRRGPLEQEEVDRFLRPSAPGATPEEEQIPKGIDPLTLKKVRTVFGEPRAEGLSAEEVGTRIGASRSTARRYLEYLVETDYLYADVVYGTVGRPERKYVRQ